MSDPSLIVLFVRPLIRLRIPYMITGGVASVIYGVARLGVQPEWEQAQRFPGEV